MEEMEFRNYPSVENIPGMNVSALFQTVEDTSSVFKEDDEITPSRVDDVEYMPWGADDSMPYKVMKLIEQNETMATCLDLTSEMLYGAGLHFCTDEAKSKVAQQVEEFSEDNDTANYFLGVCRDFKHFGFAVTVIILSGDKSRIMRIDRKEACYCRFAPCDKNGNIDYVLYGNFRNSMPKAVEKIPLLDIKAPLADLRFRLAKGDDCKKFAILTKIATVDNTYYPIPSYAPVFQGKWYRISQLIGIAKEAQLRNTSPIKYHIEISGKYWENIFRNEGITDPKMKAERVVQEKKNILEFLTGAENSGKVWFSQFYVTPDGKEDHYVLIKKIDSEKQGGDWSTDLAEAVNMICFTMRVHSNLVGSVPGKAQTNNSGSDKRELFTIGQAQQKPYRDVLLRVLKLICAFNNWKGIKVTVPFVVLTTLDKHKDAELAL